MTTKSSSLSNADVKRLLERWGFLQARTTGGHVVMRHPTGHHVKITAPGRHGTTPEIAVKQAAGVCGVSTATFMRGPKPPPKPPTFTKEPAAEPLPSAPTPVPLAPEPKVRALDAVLAFLRVRPEMSLRVSEISSGTGLPSSRVSAILRTLTKAHPEILRVGYGIYSYRRPKTEHQYGLHSDCWVWVEEDASGRVLLKGPDGRFYVASAIPQVDNRAAFAAEEGWNERGSRRTGSLSSPYGTQIRR